MRCPVETLSERDTKGLYRKALAGEIANFTGVNDPYEEPLHAEVVCDTARETPAESLVKIIDALERLGHLPKRLVARLPLGEELHALRAEARSLPRLDVGQRELSDLFMLASGGLAPLDSFMGAEDYEAVVTTGRLASGHPFTIPVVLRAVTAPTAGRLALFVGDLPVGIIDMTSAYRTDHEAEARSVYGTDDDAHPGVRVLKDSGPWAIAGGVVALAQAASGFPEYDLTPAQVRGVKSDRGWKTMVGFQTRNPVHRAHEYLQKVALETIDGLLLHPLVGETKSDDIPAAVRMSCYEELLRPSACCSRPTPRGCATPGRRKPSFTPSCEGTTAARISSSAATTLEWATTTTPMRLTASSTSTHPMSWASRSSASSTPSTVPTAEGWRHRGLARTPRHPTEH